MKWFWNYLRRRMQEQYETEDSPRLTGKPSRVRASDGFEQDGGMNMQVYKANGGRIVCFNHYDHRTDRSTRSTYIITDDQDFERELGKMITMESMRG